MALSKARWKAIHDWFNDNKDQRMSEEVATKEEFDQYNELDGEEPDEDGFFDGFFDDFFEDSPVNPPEPIEELVFRTTRLRATRIKKTDSNPEPVEEEPEQEPDTPEPEGEGGGSGEDSEDGEENEESQTSDQGDNPEGGSGGDQEGEGDSGDSPTASQKPQPGQEGGEEGKESNQPGNASKKEGGRDKLAETEARAKAKERERQEARQKLREAMDEASERGSSERGFDASSLDVETPQIPIAPNCTPIRENPYHSYKPEAFIAEKITPKALEVSGKPSARTIADYQSIVENNREAIASFATVIDAQKSIESNPGFGAEYGLVVGSDLWRGVVGGKYRADATKTARSRIRVGLVVDDSSSMNDPGGGFPRGHKHQCCQAMVGVVIESLTNVSRDLVHLSVYAMGAGLIYDSDESEMPEAGLNFKPSGGTPTRWAVTQLAGHLLAKEGKYDATIIFVVTDGASDSCVAADTENLKRLGVTVFGFGVSGASPGLVFRDFGPGRSFMGIDATSMLPIVARTINEALE